MRKELTVIRWLIVLTVHIGYSQEKLSGVYSSLMAGQEYYKTYEFKNRVFAYRYGASLGDDEYGKGHYIIEKDTLTLYYDLTELEVNSYHTYTTYTNSSDSVQVKISVFNTDKNPLQTRANVFNMKSRYGKVINNKGIAYLKFKKGIGNIKIDISDINYVGHSFFIDTRYSYEANVFLRKLPHSVAIKNEVQRFKVLEHTDRALVLLDESGNKIVWEKRE